jgi:fatty-acyl-CoA synthase
VALRFEGATLTYAQLVERIDAVAGTFVRRFGLARGDRVAYLGVNRPALLEALLACARLGTTFVPINWRLTPNEVAHVLTDSGPSVLIGDRDLLDALGPGAGVQVVAVDDGLEGDDPVPAAGSFDDALLLVYTSGTTGTPKGAVLTQAAVMANAENSVAMHDLTPSDHVLNALPMFHVGGLNIQTLPALLSGATVTLHRRFDPAAWLAEIPAGGTTLSVLVPAMMLAVIARPDFTSVDLTSLRLLVTGSSMVPLPLIEAFHERGVPVAQVYGATETGPIAVHQRTDTALTHPGSAGAEARTNAVRIVDADDGDVADGEPGELLVRGPNVFTGYWRNETATRDAFAPDGSYRTGDVGRRDADGQIWISGRLTDVIICGGENIYPAELEQIMAGCAEIAECAVVGLPDDRWGEVAVAAVVRRAGSSLDERAVVSLFDGRLARYKHPRRVAFVDSLPRTALGKVQKAELRRDLAG